jgi:cell division protein FtsA
MLKHLNQLVKFKTGMDVRIGFPGDRLAADTRDEINQPMFSTSVGLLLKGLEYYEEKQEEIILERKEEAEPVIAGEASEEERRARRGIRKGRILENLKNTLSDIFDESDVKM